MTGDDVNILRGPNIPVEIPNITLGQCLFSRLMSHNPSDTLMREAETGRTITPQEFLALSIRVAEALKKSGLKRGDVVSIMSKASIDTYAVATGVLFQGGIASPIDHTLPSDVFLHILSTTEPKLVFCDAEAADDISEVLAQLNNSARMIVMNANSVEGTFTDIFENFINVEVDFKSFRPVGSDDTSNSVSFLVCSSGTMGTPKPVMMTDRSLMYQVMVWSFLSTINKILSCPAITFSYFFWISGVLLYTAAITINFDMTIVQKMDAKHILEVIEKNKPVWGLFSPALIKYLINYPKFTSYNVSSLIFMVTGGCSLQKAVIDQIKKHWGVLISCRQSYGLTEVAGTATASSLEDDVLSVGRLLPGFQLKVVNPFDGSIQGPGQPGELYLKSPSVTKGYMKNEEATKEVVIDGWYKTGDYGYYNDKGQIYIKGRVKDFIRFNNRLISPNDIEDVVLGFPGVIDVGVVGIRADNDNYLPMALVVKRDGANLSEEDIIKWVHENLEDYKHLRGGVRFVRGIPKTPTGKMKRKELLDLALSLHSEE